MKTNKHKINILSLLPNDKVEGFKKLIVDWDKYFEVNHIFDEPENLKKHLRSNINILFIWAENYKEFKMEYYKTFKDSVDAFKLVALKSRFEDNDFEIFKLLFDDIVYTENDKVGKWKLIAILRRYWSTFSKPTTMIHGDIIADFVDNRVTVDGNEVELTNKEIKLLKYFSERVGVYIPKKEMFKAIWGFEDDTSRTLDQMIFKLKKKVGSNYFTLSRKEGYKFE